MAIITWQVCKQYKYSGIGIYTIISYIAVIIKKHDVYKLDYLSATIAIASLEC